jgi:threonine dehydrogenase-like Zn-dependent dehydrogenase
MDRMRATFMYGAGDVRVENVPDSVVKLPADALVRVTASCICGSDLSPYAGMAPGSGPARMASLLTLSDVFGTGHHAAVTGGVTPGSTVAVIGDGAVGLLAALAAKRLGAGQIILMGRHKTRTDLGREFGVTDVVAARGQEGIEAVRDLTGGTASVSPVGRLPPAPTSRS